MPTNVNNLTDLIQDTLNTNSNLIEQVLGVRFYQSPSSDSYDLVLILKDNQTVKIALDGNYLRKIVSPDDRAFTLEGLARRCEREIQEQVANKALEDIVLS